MFFNLVLFFFRWFFRNKIELLTVTFLSIVILFLMTLGFSDLANIKKHFPSIFLICTFFMGQFFLIESHARLGYEKTLQSLIMTGQNPSMVFLASLSVFSCILLCIELLIWVLMHIFFQAQSLSLGLDFLLIIFSGTLSYMSIGLLFYAFTVFSKVASTFILILFFPTLVPLFLFLHQALTALDHPLISLNIWPLIGMNFLFVFSSMLLYEFIAEDLS